MTRQAAALKSPTKCNTVVVGGGIVGLLTALWLSRAGKQVVLLERHEIGQGETARSTGHVTEILDSRFHSLIEQHGDEAIRHLSEAHRMAIHRLSSLLEELGGHSGWERVPGYLYCEHDHQTTELRQELEALASLHIPSSLQKHTPLPFPVIEAIRIEGQAMLDPSSCLSSLKRGATDSGVRIFENSPALSISLSGSLRNQHIRIRTPEGHVSAEHCVIATHSPILGGLRGLGLSHLEISPRRTYVLAARLKSPPVLEGIYWDLEHPYHYCRTRGADLWVGGLDHAVGRGNGSAGDPHRRLEEHLRARFEVERIEQKWSGQILETHDGLPIVGRTLHSDRILVATGLGGNGISMGALAATQLCDLALGRKSELASLLSPLRIPRPRSWPSLVRQNMGWAASRAKARAFHRKLPPPESLAPGEACIGHHRGKLVAMCRDDEGEICAISGRCSHMGAELIYNENEKSWDCPCHGSRFDRHGRVLSGPATEDLKPATSLLRAGAKSATKKKAGGKAA